MIARLLLFALLTPAVSIATPTLPSIEALAAQPEFSQPRLAPDGRHIALIKSDERSRTLVVIDAETMQPKAEFGFPPHRHVAGFDWANDEMLVVSQGRSGGGHAGPAYTGELFTLSINGDSRRYLFGYGGGKARGTKGRSADRALGFVIDPLPNDPQHIVIGEITWEQGRVTRRPRVHRVDIYSGARTQLADVPMADAWITTDQQGQVRYAFGQDDQWVPQTLAFDPAADRWSPVDLGLEKYGSMRPLQFAADGQSFLATISQAGEPGCLYRVNVADHARQRLTCEPDVDLDHLMPSSDPGTPLAAVYSPGAPRAHLLRAGSADGELYKTLSMLFAPAFVEILGVSRDGQRLLYEVRSDRQAGRVYLHDRATKSDRPVFERRPTLVPEQLAATHPFRFEARDGTAVSGLLTLPPNRPAQALPLVVMPHGGPYGIRDRWAVDSEAQLLATRGYAVLKVDFRGSGGYGERFVRMGYREWGGAIQDDIVDATRWAVAQGVADPARICLVGASFGGYSAMMSAIRAPELYACAVGVVGVYDLDLMFKVGDVKDTDRGLSYLREVLGEAADRRPQSPEAQAERLQAAVLLIHGSADRRAPIAHAKALRDALKRHGRSPEWLEIDGEGHGFYRLRNRVRYYTALLDFLGKQIGAAAPAPTAAAASSATVGDG